MPTPRPTDDELRALSAVLTQAQIAETFGVGVSLVQSWLADTKRRTEKGLKYGSPYGHTPRPDVDYEDLRRQLIARAVAIATDDQIYDPKVKIQQARLAIELYTALGAITAPAPSAEDHTKDDLLATVKRATASATRLRAVS